MIRVGRTHAFALAWTLALALAPAPALAQLPSLGDAYELTPSAERRIGERIARELYRDPDYIDDPLLGEYVQTLWRPLLAAARLRGEMTPELDRRYAWRVLLGRDRSINAFALPGGWLGLHLGLVAVTTTRDELASVLAHELSHVTQRHIARMMAQDKRQTPWVIGAIILGALAASKSPDAAAALITGGQAAAVQGQLNFSRDMEREADRIGLGVLTQAGFEPQGFVTMFEKLQQASRLNDNGAFPYLRTHPLNLERVVDMRSRQPLGERPAAPPPDLEHALMAARARALSAGGVELQQALVREADNVPAAASRAQRAAAGYAGALAAMQLREPARALRYADQLAPLVADHAAGARLARLLSAQLALDAGDSARAWAESGAGLVSRRPELLLSSQAAVRLGRPAEAAQRLQTWVTLVPSDAAAWQLLASAQAAQGQALRAIRSEAEVRVANLDYPAAMDRLRAAQDLARRGTSDHIEASIIDTRARVVESLLREQALER
jgi:predicted Zn-dependent protease